MNFYSEFKDGQRKEKMEWSATHDEKKLLEEKATMMPPMLTKPPCRYWNCFFHQQSEFFETEKERCSVVELSAVKKRAGGKEVR